MRHGARGRRQRPDGGTKIWPASGWQTIASNDAFGLASNVSTSVAPGDSLYFVVNANSGAAYDTAIWDVTVTQQ